MMNMTFVFTILIVQILMVAYIYKIDSDTLILKEELLRINNNIYHLEKWEGCDK